MYSTNSVTDSLGSSYVSFIIELTHTDNGGTVFEVIGWLKTKC